MLAPKQSKNPEREEGEAFFSFFRFFFLGSVSCVPCPLFTSLIVVQKCHLFRHLLSKEIWFTWNKQSKVESLVKKVLLEETGMDGPRNTAGD